MTDKRAAKREDLRDRLMVSAEVRIAQFGLKELRARDVTSDAGCALGALYLAFEDLDALVLEVNARTLRHLDAVMNEALLAAENPGAEMHILARTYLSFARENTNLWWALFLFHMSNQRKVPDWFSQEQAMLLTQIIRPLAKLQPDMSQDQLMVRARTLFAAVHGIVSVSLENRFVGVPLETLDGELERFIDLMLAGLPNSKIR
ncbi:MAG: TetR/AcrR family transcriptional regulator [Rhizobiaceae bacterium]